MNNNLTILSLSFLLPVLPLCGANLVWDTSTQPGYQNGSGVWDTTNAFWTSTGGDGTTLQAWSNSANDTAWLGGNAAAAATPGGNVTLSLGDIQADSIRQIVNGSGDFTLTGGSLTLTGAAGLRVDRGTLTVNTSIASSIPSMNLMAGAGTILALGGNNTFTSQVVLGGAGTVRLDSATALGSGSGGVLWNANGARIDLNGQAIAAEPGTVRNDAVAFMSNTSSQSASWGGNIALSNAASILRAGGATADLDVSGVISGAGGLNVDDNTTLTLSGANTYAGDTVIRSGATLRVNNDNALGTTSGSTVIQANAKLDLNGHNIGSEAILFQSSGSKLVNESQTAASSNGNITINHSLTGVQIGGSGDMTLNGVISGSSGFAKTGTGTLTLTAANTLTGDITVENGTLLVENSNGSGTGFGDLIVAEGGTLGGNGNIGGNVLLNGMLQLGALPGTLNFGGDLTLGSTAVINMEIAGTSTGEFDVIAGTSGHIFTASGALNLATLGEAFALGDTIRILEGWGSFGGSFASVTGLQIGEGLYWDTSRLLVDGTLTVVVPEPSTYAAVMLLVCGFVATVYRRHRRAI